MDPLSITTSVIAIAGLAAAASRAFRDLRTLCRELPGRWHALSNDVADMELVLRQVASVLSERREDNDFVHQHFGIAHLLSRARAALEEIVHLVQRFADVAQRTRAPLFRARAWRSEYPRLRELQEALNAVKTNLNVTLAASTSRDMARIRVDLVELSAIGQSSDEQRQVDLQQGITSILHHGLADIKELVREQTEQLIANQTLQIGPVLRQRRPSSSKRTGGGPGTPILPAAVRVQVSKRGACRPGCTCRCHAETRKGSPGLVDRVLGRLFVGYSGLPMLSEKCDLQSCEKAQMADITLEYWFPLAFVWSSILSFRLSYEPNLGPQFELRSLRRVADSAPCVSYALNGDIAGLRDLFKRGLASPRDVSSTRGYSILRWAVYGKQWQTAKYLAIEGADADYRLVQCLGSQNAANHTTRPIAISDNSPRNKAHQFLLKGDLDPIAVEALRFIVQGDDDFVEEQCYTTLHKVVLGLSMRTLDEVILEDPEKLDVTDVMGRTPLAWAAVRTDEQAIVTLLRHGAEVNTLDIQYSGIVAHAADGNSAVCVKLLLEAGADPNISAAHGHQVGNGINVAARNASDPLILKLLLDYGVQVDNTGVDKITALIHAARKDNVSFTLILLEHGADINAISSAGHTPLNSAIVYNSHNVLQLLLDRWFEYTECPRLKGPHLLQTAATYADIETLSMLAATDHLMLMYDKEYHLGDFEERLRTRHDATEKLFEAFNDLLVAVRHNAESRRSDRSRESLMEDGLLNSIDLDLSRLRLLDDGGSNSSDSEQAFEDASEEPMTEKAVI